MIKNEKLDDCRRMCLWIDEIPDDCEYSRESSVHRYEANKAIKWFNGIICLELRIAARDASNYAMLNFKFTGDNSGIFNVSIKNGGENRRVISNIAAPKDIVSNGIVQKYEKVLIAVFDQLSEEKIFPEGTLEILGGRCGVVGTSPIAVAIVAQILIELFKLGEQLAETNVKGLIMERCKREVFHCKSE